MENYRAPDFAAEPSPLPKDQPNAKYAKVEIIKNGTIVDSFPLDKSPVFIGRIPECQVEMQHASVSRVHAVLQYSKDNRWFIYDLGSTHGTRLNKHQVVKPGEFVPIPDGSMLQFGASTRFLTLSYPDLPSADREEYTEQLEISNIVDGTAAASDTEKSKQDEKPAILKENAKKELEKWMKKNGYDDMLAITISKGTDAKDFTAHLSLNVFTGDDAEYLNLRGRGRSQEDATAAACLAAIHELIVLGVFYKKPKKKRGKNDSDSDEEVLDMTRQNKNIRRSEKEPQEVLTFDSLMKEKSALETQLQMLQDDLQRENDKKVGKQPDDEQDDLEEDDEFEAYMSKIETNLKTSNVSLIMEQISQTKKELEHVDSLLQMIKPIF